MKRKIGFALLLIGSVASSGCGVLLPSSDTFVMIGNEESIRAYHDGINGIISSTKTQDPLGNSAYWDSRQAQERSRTLRSGFWQKLTGSEAKGK